MRANRTAALLLAAWSCGAPLQAASGGDEQAWARGGRDFDGLPGRPAGAGPVLAGNMAGGRALAELAAMDGASEAAKGAAVKAVPHPAPEKKSDYWRYNDYSHSTGESIGMLALDVLAWVFAVILVPVFVIVVLFSFLRPK